TQREAALPILENLALGNDPHTALPAQLGYGAFIALAHVAWFGLVACFLSSPAVRGRLLRFRRRIDQFFGALLVGFGVLLGAKSP
ncbi:hypothetical protein ACLBV4_01350, partial [Pseudomonas aeruginosa]